MDSVLLEAGCGSGEWDEQEVMWEWESGCRVRENKIGFIYSIYSK